MNPYCPIRFEHKSKVFIVWLSKDPIEFADCNLHMSADFESLMWRGGWREIYGPAMLCIKLEG